MFSREQIEEAKAGTHWIAWGPGQKEEPVTVSRVRSETIFVLTTTGTEVFLNKTASALLIDGKYRR